MMQMIMKNKFYFILACLLVSALSGCSKYLDQAPDGKISLEEVFQDNEKTMYYLNSCYSGIPQKGVNYWFWNRGPVEWNDEAYDADDLDVDWGSSRKTYDGNATASSHPHWVWGDGTVMGWQRYFPLIRKCAVFLQNIESASVDDEDERQRWIAEAHLLRAYYYGELLKTHGCGLPIIREPFTLDADFTQVTRGSYYDVVKFIIEDCDAAIACDQLPWRITSGADQLRMTKAVAWALKSRMINFAASPLYNEGENHWDEAYKINKDAVAALESHGYKLYSDISVPAIWDAEETCLPNRYAKIFNEFFSNPDLTFYAENPVDCETIYRLDDSPWDLANVDGIGCLRGYKTGTCPTQELVDAFETTDGQPILDLAKPYNDVMHLQPNYNKANTLYDPQNPYANRDPRFYATVYYNGALRNSRWATNYDQYTDSKVYENAGKASSNDANQLRVVATWCRYEDAKGNIIESPEPLMGFNRRGRMATRTGYFERKFLHPNFGGNFTGNAGKFKDFRLAEIYLNMAEAAMESGNTADAYTYVNKVRARVGMPAITGITGDALRLRIHNEFRVELALEGNRYYDIRRWTSPDGDLEQLHHYVTAAAITHMQDGSYKYDREIVRELNDWSNKWLKPAVPLSEVNNMIALTGENWQNPGW